MWRCKINSKTFALFYCVVPSCKRLVAGAIPTLNLPKKNTPATTSSSVPRRELVRQELAPKPQYSNFEDFKKKVNKLKLHGWTKNVKENNANFVLCDEEFTLQKFSVTVLDSLNFSISVYNWLLPEEHTIYKFHRGSLQYFTQVYCQQYKSSICVMDFPKMNTTTLSL